MWKCASKAINSLFWKQQFSHCNVTTREARNGKSVNYYRKCPPLLFGPSHRSYGCEGQQNGPFTQYDKEKPKTEKNNLSNGFLNILGALRWSWLCALGWCILHPFSHRKLILRQEQSDKCAFHALSKYTLSEYLQFVNYFSRVQPWLHALPEVKGTKSKKRESLLDDEVNACDYDTLERAHMAVVGSLSNFQGANCMNKGNYEEAIRYFEEAAEVQHLGAMYNLGVCYEFGLGTNQNFKKAAEMYKRASDLGHPTATYNLGVFYVHGLGDLKADHNTARKLFQIAASQGQPNAKKALDMERSAAGVGGGHSTAVEENDNTERESSRNVSEKQRVELSCRKRDNLGKIDLSAHSFVNSVKNGKREQKSVSSDDSGAFDLSPEVQVLI